MKLDYHKRAVTYEQIVKLVDAAIDAPESDEEHAQACAAVLSMESERDRYRAALEKVAQTAVARTAREIAREALSTTTTGERT